MIQPAMPTKAVEMRRQLGLPADFATLRWASELEPGNVAWTRVEPGPPLFPRLDLKA
jgi:methionyl-tRNA synthetase